jgi:acyl-CoA hydrolase
METKKERHDFKPVSFSKTTMTELMVPTYANFGGKVHGGTILSLMDKVAYVCSSKHAGTYCVTVSVDTVDFLKPVEVGDLVSLHASVNYVGKSSLIVGIKAVAENFKDQHVVHTNTSYFTMVAVDEAVNPCRVPGLILENHEDVRRFIKSKIRKEFKQQKRQELNEMIERIQNTQDLSILDGEHCIVAASVEGH